MSLFKGKYPFSLVVFPLSQSDLWGVNLCEGEILIYHSKDRKDMILADARRIAEVHCIQIMCTLEHFFDLTVESDATGTETWMTASGYTLIWNREAFSNEHLGLDHLTVRKGDQDRGSFYMYHDTDSDIVEKILTLIAEEKPTTEIFGSLS